MNHPDDYVNARTPFHGDETGEVFAVKELEPSKSDPFERSFETQSGFLVLVKPIGSRFSLSFKRRIGTPPSSSIFLTPDEAQRLANILRPDSNRENESIDYPELDERTAYINLLMPVKSKQSKVAETMILVLGTVLLGAVIFLIAYELRHGH